VRERCSGPEEPKVSATGGGKKAAWGGRLCSDTVDEDLPRQERKNHPKGRELIEEEKKRDPSLHGPAQPVFPHPQQKEPGFHWTLAP